MCKISRINLFFSTGTLSLDLQSQLTLFLQDVVPNFKTLQPTPNLPLHPIPLLNHDEITSAPSNNTPSLEVLAFHDPPQPSVLTTAPSMPASMASLTAQLETFSNSIGSGFSNLQCVNPTDVHIDGYLSPTPNKSINNSSNISPIPDRPKSTEIQPELPCTSRNLTSRLPSNIDCSSVDFASVNEELLSPANFTTYDSSSLGSIPSTKTIDHQRISSPKDISECSIPAPIIGTTTKKDIINNDNPMT